MCNQIHAQRFIFKDTQYCFPGEILETTSMTDNNSLVNYTFGTLKGD